LSEHSVDPRTLAGDPFPAAAQDHDERPRACNDGWVSMGVEDEEGNIEEVLYLCRRCRERGE
jgi:hypothetical protein